MRTTRLTLICAFSMFLAAAAQAQSPREQLTQMVEQLQATPSNDSLRVDIIKLALTIDPPPALPEEAERRMARGTAAFKGAASPADYKDAVAEFSQAALAAPWYGAAYFNLGVAQDKAEDFAAALSSLKLAQLALPDDKEIKTLTFEVDYRSEKHSPEAEAKRQAAADQERVAAFIKSLDGAVFIWPVEWDADSGRNQFELRVDGGTATWIRRWLSLGSRSSRGGGTIVGYPYEFGTGKITGMYFTIGQGGRATSFQISPDGRSIASHGDWSGTFYRQ